MNGFISVDQSLYDKKTLDLVRQADICKEAFLDEQAPLLFGDVAKLTGPIADGGLPSLGRRSYGTSKDKKAGEVAVRRDVRRAMTPVAPASRWNNPQIKKAIRRKDTEKLEKIFKHMKGSEYEGYKVANFNPAFHENARDSRGRVRSSQRQLVVTKTQFNQYLRNVLKRVGQGKALFAWAAMEMGGPQAAKWISRHFYRYRARVMRGEDFRSATASGGALVSVISKLPYIERARGIRAKKRLQYQLREAIKKSGF